MATLVHLSGSTRFLVQLAASAGAVVMLFVTGVSQAGAEGVPVGAAQMVVDRQPRPLGTPKSSEGSSPAPGESASFSWSSSSPLVRTSVALGGVLCVIVVLASTLKRFSRPGSPLAAALGSSRSPAGVLEVLGRYPLARGHTLVLVKIERRVLLLGVTAGRLRSGGGSVCTLATLEDPEDVASILLKVQDAEGAATADRFRQLLDRFDTTHGDGVHTVDASSHLRRVQDTDDGDRAELWDDRAEPLRLADAMDAVSRARVRGGRA